MTDAPKPPKELDAIVDKFLSYKPKPKSDVGNAHNRKVKLAKRLKSDNRDVV